MNNNRYAVLMAGGVGSRFWPYSRTKKPKQFIDIFGNGKSLIQLTYERFSKFLNPDNIYIVTHASYIELVKEQIPAIKDHQIIAEPEKRNTAPCIAYAAYKINNLNPKASIIVSPSDQAIFNEEEFYKEVDKGFEAAEASEKLITIGIKPSRPETGYGYIQFIENGSEIKKVKTFTEKPHLELATKFYESGEYVWNAGIFIWSAATIIKSFEKLMPELVEIFDPLIKAMNTAEEETVVQNVYSLCKSTSIDYGVMEKADNVYMVLGKFDWSDLGSWNSLHEITEKEESNNVIMANSMLYDVENSLIKGPEDKLILVQGLKDYLVADCENVLIICKKDQEKQFREFVSDVKKEKGDDFI